jgi:hypothetical protein
VWLCGEVDDARATVGEMIGGWGRGDPPVPSDKHWAIFKLNAGKLNMALDRKLVGGRNGWMCVSWD